MLKNCTHVLDHFYRQLCCIKLYRNIIIFLFQNFQGSAGAAGSKGDTGVPGPQGYPGPPGTILALPTPGGPDAGPLGVGHVRKSLIKLAHFDHTCHSIIPNPLLEIQRPPPLGIHDHLPYIVKHFWLLLTCCSLLRRRFQGSSCFVLGGTKYDGFSKRPACEARLSPAQEESAFKMASVIFSGQKVHPGSLTLMLYLRVEPC